MNASIIQTKKENAHFGVDYCKRTFNAPGHQVVNSYKCNQKQFSSSDMWSIQRQRRQITIGPGIRVI
jgi:hypothetical protein